MKIATEDEPADDPQPQQPGHAEHALAAVECAFQGRPELQGVAGNADDPSLEETGSDPRVHEYLAMERNIVLMMGLFAGGKHDIGADFDRAAGTGDKMNRAECAWNAVLVHL